MSTGALAGITVVDLSRILGGPYCTQILADHGAEVIKVEPPQGDDTRTWGPPFPAPGVSSYFAGINRNKTMITLDLATQQQEKWKNTTLPDFIKGRANPEVVWLPVGAQGILVILGGVIYPDFVEVNRKSENLAASVRSLTGRDGAQG